MSAEEITLAIGSAAAAIAAGSLGIYLYARRRPRTGRAVEHVSVTGKATQTRSLSVQELFDERSGKRIIPKSQLEKSRRELKTLLLEKELISGALTRLYEAEAQREISREERETLSKRYRNELAILDEKISKIEALVEIGDLETLRDQLLRLVMQKVDAIEARLERTRPRAQSLITELSGKTKGETVADKTVPDISHLISSKPKAPENVPPKGEIAVANQAPALETPEIASSAHPQVEAERNPAVNQRKRAPEATSSRTDELQKEILEALERLEKLDVEGS